MARQGRQELRADRKGKGGSRMGANSSARRPLEKASFKKEGYLVRVAAHRLHSRQRRSRMPAVNVAAELRTIPARKGIAERLAKGQRIRVVNTHGSQVVDCWAFTQADLREFMSMEHCRVELGRAVPRVGDSMVTNKRRPILTLLEDTSPGVHDTTLAACDIYRYARLGASGNHDNCTDNLAAALERIGLAPPGTPCPFNLWENSRIQPDFTQIIEAPVSKPGDHVTLRAELDLVIVLSACPQDMVPTNGADCRPTEAHYAIS